MAESVLETLSNFGIIPVVKIEDARKARPLAEALRGAGLPCAEITFRTDAAEESIRNISRKVPDMLVGAGTVLTTDQAERAISAGARFIVSPGLNEAVVRFCQEKNIAVMPGVATATEIQQALRLGLSTLKFFPAEASGGLKTLKALAPVFGGVKFIPTGGVNSDTMLAYLQSGFVAAVGGSWMVKSDLIRAGQFEEITARTREAIKKMLGFRLKKVVFNGTEDLLENLSRKLQGDFLALFNFLEVSKKEQPERLVVGTHFPGRAAFFLKNLGLRSYLENGLIFIESPIKNREIVLETID
ncbi:MAG: bifunctional 4-hydroxy-2-oxoglutarate aldolase/2-dehydro-3-deoxy-phosphogluconate aldolase [Calditrichaeota bacterium]|nr:bifunctional 4-hydroxy-2-oxoglutarate aldolase/2-dehydro-3-deoxy-phosphogluconate aldolase [Calditrichota bacterium]